MECDTYLFHLPDSYNLQSIDTQIYNKKGVEDDKVENMFFVNLLTSPYTSKKDSRYDFVGRGLTPPLRGQIFLSEM
jgi:hypothetical protein